MQNTTRFSAFFLLISQMFLSPIVHAEDLSVSPALKIKAASLQVASLLASESERRNGKLWYRETSAIEVLLYRSPLIAAAAEKNENYDFEFKGKRKIHFEAATHVLSYESRRISVSLEITAQSLESEVVRKNILGVVTKDEKGTLSLEGINEAELTELAQSLYDKTL
jgi:hypothetical protein